VSRKLAVLLVCLPTLALAAPAPGARAKKEAVLGKGQTVVPGTWTWKVEGNGLGGGLESSDVWWEQVSGTERNLVPLGGAAWAVLKGKPFEKVRREDLAGAAYSNGKLSGALLRPGTVVALRTRDGKYAKLKVVRYRALHDFSFPEARHLPDRWRRFALRRPDVKEYHLEVSWVLYADRK
jgi:hypothetical protein